MATGSVREAARGPARAASRSSSRPPPCSRSECRRPRSNRNPADHPERNGGHDDQRHEVGIQRDGQQRIDHQQGDDEAAEEAALELGPLLLLVERASLDYMSVWLHPARDEPDWAAERAPGVLPIRRDLQAAMRPPVAAAGPGCGTPSTPADRLVRCRTRWIPRALPRRWPRVR